MDSYCGKRTILVGDAGSMTRPHTASGATKVLEDVLSIEELLAEVDDIETFMNGYNEKRCHAAQTLNEIGRNIREAQVINTPNWEKMSAQDFEAWIAAP